MTTDAGNEAGDRDGAEGASGSPRLTQPPDAAPPPRLPFPVVGVGASAGGLEAYSDLLDATPADTGCAFVLIQHLPPDRESLLTELLARHTAMPVLQVEDGQPVEPNHVYVIRPGHTLTLKDGRLRLGAELAARGHSRPVDDFFRSLAEEQQQRAIAVVLSGMGSNGTAGAEVVKTVGGLVIAQDPDSAKFPAMPRSLIDAHLADYVLRPAEVPEAIVRYAGQPYTAGGRAGPPRDDAALADILAVLRTRTRHDFTGYRKPTLVRRIQRRMGLAQVESMGDYARLLRQTGAEVGTLADDLLIHVTGFFRDPEAWEALREKVVEPLVADRADGGPVRCWVTACATGEEAYTLAMLLAEAGEARGKQLDVKVFATDMAERALGLARAGVFPGGIESEVSPERLQRFFDPDEGFYRVKRELRERVIFAPQNVLQDPPFSRLDIVTCRNLLIYLEPDTQRRVLQLLHFGLRDGGALMLGSTESAGVVDGDFEPIDKRHRLFRRVGGTRHGALSLPPLAALAREATPVPPAVRSPGPATAAQLVARALLDRHTPAAVAVDGAGQVVHVHGDTARYLTLPSGLPSLDLLALANDQVRGAVRTALHRAADTQAPVTVRDGLIDTADGRRRVEVGAAPLLHRVGPPLYLITFSDYPEPPAPAPAADGDPAAGRGGDEELQRVRDELQSTIEELQTSAEELKASHEEATSINEELQSTNEELETGKEELQSLNEELVTVNAQLQAKMTELEATGNDLASLLTSTDIAVLFLDQRFRIRRYTPAVRDLLDLIPSDIGRPLADLRRKFTDPDLQADAQAVLDRLVPIEREVRSDSGRLYLRRVLPYRTLDNRIDGVVLAFVDVTALKQAELAVRESRERLRLAAIAAQMGVWRWEVAGDRHVRDANLNRLLGLPAEETTGPLADFLAVVHPDDRAGVAAGFDHTVREGRNLSLEFRVVWPDRTVRWLRDQGDVFDNLDAGSRYLTGAAVDVTALKDAEAGLRQARDELEVRVKDGTREPALAVAALQAEAAARQTLAARLETAREEERTRLARELHDSIGQYLTGMALGLAAARGAADRPEEVQTQLDRLKALTDEMGQEAHRLAVELRPTALDDVGLDAAIQALVEGWSGRTGIRADFGSRGLDGERPTDPPATAVYRAVQECLTNVLKHAGATRVSVLLDRQPDSLLAIIEDDGRGFDPDAPPAADTRGGLGLPGMRERIALAGGTLQVESTPGVGTAVYVRVPLAAADPE